MNTIQTKALVLKTCNMNDNDKLVTLFSAEFGRLTAIAKGVRSHKHKDFAALQPFCYSDVVLNCKQGGLYTVSSTQVINNFYDLRSDVLKVSFASYYMDVIADIAHDIVGDEEYLKFVLNTLYLISNIKEKDDLLFALKKLKMIFEIKTVSAMGVMPEMNRCVCCGKEKEIEYFSSKDGGVVCANCVGRYSGQENPPIKINDVVCKVINYILSVDSRSVFNFNITNELLDIVCAISESYIVSQTDSFYKSLSFLHKMILGNNE